MQTKITDADGRFEIGPLPPGDYQVGVNVEWPARLESPYPPTYFPGVVNRAQAETITIHLDEEAPQAEGERLAAERAVDFIAAFMADSTVLRVRRERGLVVSAGTHPVDSLEAPPDSNEADYLWSGPRRLAGA